MHRGSLFLAQYLTRWNEGGSATGASRQHAWLRSLYASLHPYASGQAYQNYADPDLTTWQQAYYGANYARLSQVKAAYDPHQVFRFPQGITPGSVRGKLPPGNRCRLSHRLRRMPGAPRPADRPGPAPACQGCPAAFP